MEASRAEIPSPPEELQARVGGPLDFTPEDQTRYLQYLRTIGIKATDDVLDVGCGIGRAAATLTPYLTGQYRGFDPDAELIAYCEREITPRFPNFQFAVLDVFSSFYNPSGRVSPAEVTFPYPDEHFDFVFLMSVFTHILQDGFERYCTEISRVLRPGGTVCATFFLLNESALASLGGKAGEVEVARRLLEQDGVCRTGMDAPEHFVAYDEKFVRDVFRANDLHVEAVVPGTWSRLADGTTRGSQDTVTARRAPRPLGGPQ